MEPSTFGQPITPTQAKEYVETYKSLRDKLIDEILNKCSQSTDVVANKDTANFHASEANAFIFDTSLVKKLVEGPDAGSHLMVFLGADGTKPTVVVTGVNQSSNDKNKFMATSAGPIQHPTVKVDAKFPDTDSGDYYFTLRE